jgi:hypothetical protein
MPLLLTWMSSQELFKCFRKLILVSFVVLITYNTRFHNEYVTWYDKMVSRIYLAVRYVHDDNNKFLKTQMLPYNTKVTNSCHQNRLKIVFENTRHLSENLREKWNSLLTVPWTMSTTRESLPFVQTTTHHSNSLFYFTLWQMSQSTFFILRFKLNYIHFHISTSKVICKK